MVINNPYIPGDPYSYDLKWIVAIVKEILQLLGTLDETIEKKIFEGFVEHSIVQFHNVADMLAADLKDGSIVFTLGYYEAGDMGSTFYLIKDFNPGQCSLNYFLTMDNNAQIAIPVIVTDYVTPIMFGAVGDGNTDDTNAVSTAMTYLDENRKILFPNVEKGYYITTPLTITKPESCIDMRSPIWYRGSGAAITIETYHVYGDFMVQNGAGGVEYYDAPAGTVGLKLTDAIENNITVKSIYGFETGVLLEGDTDGCAYNSITLNVVGRCKTGVRCASVGANGWANENKFFGGEIWVASSDPFKNICVGYSLEGNANHQINGNIVFGTCLEGMNKAINLDYAVLNKFYSVRTESCTYALYATNSHRDVVDVSYGTTDYYSDYPSEKVSIAEAKDVCKSLICDSGDLSTALVYNNSENFFKNGLSGMFTGLVDLVSYNQLTRHSGYVSIDGVRYIATKVSAHSNKIFRVTQNCVDGGTCRPFVSMFDANGVNITSGLIPGEPAEVFTTDTVGGSTIFKAVADWTDFIFQVPQSCEYVIIGFGRSSSSKISNYKIFAPDPNTYVFSTNYNGLSAIPNSPAIAGDVCPNKNGGTNGWRYTGSTWTAV